MRSHFYSKSMIKKIKLKINKFKLKINFWSYKVIIMVIIHLFTYFHIIL